MLLVFAPGLLLAWHGQGRFCRMSSSLKHKSVMSAAITTCHDAQIGFKLGIGLFIVHCSLWHCQLDVDEAFCSCSRQDYLLGAM